MPDRVEGQRAGAFDGSRVETGRVSKATRSVHDGNEIPCPSERVSVMEVVKLRVLVLGEMWGQANTYQEKRNNESSFDHSKVATGDNISIIYLRKCIVTLYICEWIEIVSLASF